MVESDGNSYQYDGKNRRVKQIDSEGTSYSFYSQSGQLVYRETENGGVNYIYFAGKLIAKDGVVPKNASKQHFSPFGKSIEGEIDDVGYTGHKFDKDLDLIYAQARYYDPTIGRFYSNDPIGFRDVHSFNRYAYANNNPYKYVDPTGMSSTCPSYELKDGGCNSSESRNKEDSSVNGREIVVVTGHADGSSSCGGGCTSMTGPAAETYVREMQNREYTQSQIDRNTAKERTRFNAELSQARDNLNAMNCMSCSQAWAVGVAVDDFAENMNYFMMGAVAVPISVGMTVRIGVALAPYGHIIGHPAYGGSTIKSLRSG